jgi:hypothetical protein
MSTKGHECATVTAYVLYNGQEMNLSVPSVWFVKPGNLIVHSKLAPPRAVRAAWYILMDTSRDEMNIR